MRRNPPSDSPAGNAKHRVTEQAETGGHEAFHFLRLPSIVYANTADAQHIELNQSDPATHSGRVAEESINSNVVLP